MANQQADYPPPFRFEATRDPFFNVMSNIQNNTFEQMITDMPTKSEAELRKIGYDAFIRLSHILLDHHGGSDGEATIYDLFNIALYGFSVSLIGLIDENEIHKKKEALTSFCYDDLAKFKENLESLYETAELARQDIPSLVEKIIDGNPSLSLCLQPNASDYPNQFFSMLIYCACIGSVNETALRAICKIRDEYLRYVKNPIRAMEEDYHCAFDTNRLPPLPVPDPEDNLMYPRATDFLMFIRFSSLESRDKALAHMQFTLEDGRIATMMEIARTMGPVHMMDHVAGQTMNGNQALDPIVTLFDSVNCPNKLPIMVVHAYRKPYPWFRDLARYVYDCMRISIPDEFAFVAEVTDNGSDSDYGILFYSFGDASGLQRAKICGDDISSAHSEADAAHGEKMPPFNGIPLSEELLRLAGVPLSEEQKALLKNDGITSFDPMLCALSLDQDLSEYQYDPPVPSAQSAAKNPPGKAKTVPDPDDSSLFAFNEQNVDIWEGLTIPVPDEFVSLPHLTTAEKNALKRDERASRLLYGFIPEEDGPHFERYPDARASLTILMPPYNCPMPDAFQQPDNLNFSGLSTRHLNLVTVKMPEKQLAILYDEANSGVENDRLWISYVVFIIKGSKAYQAQFFFNGLESRKPAHRSVLAWLDRIVDMQSSSSRQTASANQKKTPSAAPARKNTDAKTAALVKKIRQQYRDLLDKWQDKLEEDQARVSRRIGMSIQDVEEDMRRVVGMRNVFGTQFDDLITDLDSEGKKLIREGCSAKSVKAIGDLIREIFDHQEDLNINFGTTGDLTFNIGEAEFSLSPNSHAILKWWENHYDSLPEGKAEKQKQAEQERADRQKRIEQEQEQKKQAERDLETLKATFARRRKRFEEQHHAMQEQLRSRLQSEAEQQNNRLSHLKSELASLGFFRFGRKKELETEIQETERQIKEIQNHVRILDSQDNGKLYDVINFLGKEGKRIQESVNKAYPVPETDKNKIYIPRSALAAEKMDSQDFYTCDRILDALSQGNEVSLKDLAYYLDGQMTIPKLSGILRKLCNLGLVTRHENGSVVTFSI